MPERSLLDALTFTVAQACGQTNISTRLHGNGRVRIPPWDTFGEQAPQQQALAPPPRIAQGIQTEVRKTDRQDQANAAPDVSVGPLGSLREGFTLGAFTVEPALNRLSSPEQELRLEPKVMDILVCLAETPNVVLSKQDLLDRVWSGRFVVDAVLKRGIHQLRKALGDSASAPQYIETVAKRGYRLLPAVHPLEDAVPEKHAASATPEPSGQHDADLEPYRGLMSFRFDDAPYFFGRRRDVIEVLHAMRRQASAGRAFVLVTGPSGAGKSSLVRAGVMPWLYQHGLQDAGEQWRRAEFVPGNTSAFTTLAAALGRPQALGDIAQQTLSEDLPAGGLEAKLRQPPEEVVQWLSQLLQPPAQPPVQLVLLLDQFEELLARGSLPILKGPVIGVFMIDEDWRDWDVAAIVRYRSVRDMLDMIVGMADSGLSVHKFASIKQTHVFPVEAEISLFSVRLTIALLLLCFALLVRLLVRRSG